ncbi:DUF418 domain-containing protein [Prevotella sp. 10(H)]|uniref:DUF418 domain-containing protein n=1 Tax=Prevotella sp. 10(H) TaxID=1158294 RepID=UPI0004A7727A|nr:DUF418 domain-containing protein [Prevotella sp. 10(H)]
MKQQSSIIPKKRINSIDALRGLALIGILIWHCIEHFDLVHTPVLDSPFWQSVDDGVHTVARFIFQGKAYAIFSLLFGLSFFIQMDSQADKGYDFRLRFLWRLFILLILGYLNGLIYMGEFFVIYATVGVILIPLYKVPTKWLIGLGAILFLQVPQIMEFVSLLNNNVPNEPNKLNIEMSDLFSQAANVFINGSFWDVLSFNTVKGQTAKLLWFINEYRYLQLAGLFIFGMLIGRSGIHKSEEKMVKYSKKVMPYAFAWFAVFYAIVLLLPMFGVKDFALEVGIGLFQTYANLGMLLVYVSGFTLLYYKSKSGRKVMDKIAPVGRMSVTNYMAQSFIGIFLFYGFGLNMAVECSYLQIVIVALFVCAFQIFYSNWWIKRFYYGPMEWIWRMLTWLKPVPLRRKE